MVVVHHATIMADERLGVVGHRWLSGAAGVDIFFVISGFVMALSSRSLAHKVSPGFEFLKRRVERIFPLYWIFTTLKIAIAIAIPASMVNGLGSTWHVIGSYLLIPSMGSSGTSFPILLVGWTLELEMMFYVVFAIALGLRARPLLILIPVLGLTALLPFAVHLPASPWEAYCNPIVVEFLFGIGLYEAYRRGVRLPH
jgi:peptidoglycan/LPS O-acetylase OafA/YrhL